VQFYLWAEFPQIPAWGPESHTPTRQPNKLTAAATNKHTHPKPLPGFGDGAVCKFVNFAIAEFREGSLGGFALGLFCVCNGLDAARLFEVRQSAERTAASV
jgi:hypothetical protein